MDLSMISKKPDRKATITKLGKYNPIMFKIYCLL